MNKSSIVRDQYEQYPYPIRDPEAEKERIHITGGEFLEELNHWLYKGKESFQRRFRILVAGGGTGDASTFLGEQLKNSNAEIVYLDFSKASLEIAKRRAKFRGIKNIRWIQGNILNIPQLNLGKFDYISCTGVLHHLESPIEGLNILKDALNARGGMLLMLYGKYGRTGVYHMQELMRLLNEGTLDAAEEVASGKELIKELPPTNWFFRGKELTRDYLESDSGFYDLFLHKQDRAYTIPEVYELLEQAGLHLINFAIPADRLALRAETYIKNPDLLQKIKQLSSIKQQAFSELLGGDVIRHGFYVSKQEDPSASLEDLNNIPYFFVPSEIPKQLSLLIDKHSLQPGDTATLLLTNTYLKNRALDIPITPYTPFILRHMISESKTLKEIFNAVRKDLKLEISDEIFIKEAKALFEPFIFLGVLVLRDKSTWPNYIRPNTNHTEISWRAKKLPS